MGRDWYCDQWALEAWAAEDLNTQSPADLVGNCSFAAAVGTQFAAEKFLQAGFGSQSVVAGCIAPRSLLAAKSIAIVAGYWKLAVGVVGYLVDYYYLEKEHQNWAHCFEAAAEVGRPEHQTR